MDTKEITTLQVQGIKAETLLKNFEELKAQINTLLDRTNPTPQIEAKLLTRKETALILGVSLVTIHNWVKGNVLKAYRVGNKVFFKENEVREALQQINTKL